MIRPAVAALACVGLAGCASALREPPAIVELAGAGAARRGPEDVDALLAEAERAFGSRTLESVRLASQRWLLAASADETRIEGLVGAARAGAWLAEHTPEKDERAAVARKAVQAAQLCGRVAPDEAECTYWLGVTLGLQAREVRSTALDALPRIVELLESAARDAPRLDFAGPDRVLAFVLLRAPGWPRGPGDPETGLEHARRAVELAPDYPPNHLCLAEALADNEDDPGSRAAYDHAALLAESLLAEGHPDAAEWLEEARMGHSPKSDP